LLDRCRHHPGIILEIILCALDEVDGAGDFGTHTIRIFQPGLKPDALIAAGFPLGLQDRERLLQVGGRAGDLMRHDPAHGCKAVGLAQRRKEDDERHRRQRDRNEINQRQAHRGDPLLH